MRKLWYVAAVGMLFVGACSGDDGESAADTTVGAPDDDAADAGVTTTAGRSSGCPDETALSLVAEGDDRSLAIVTGRSDQGPHPDNTVDYDGSLELVFADYEIPVDEQFGYAIPIAGSEVPPDGTELQISLEYDGLIEPGLTFVDQTADADVLAEHDGEINFISLHQPGGRAVLGETVVMITGIEDDVVCGEISGVTETDLQQFTAVQGEFVVDRVQALEAASDDT